VFTDDQLNFLAFLVVKQSKSDDATFEFISLIDRLIAICERRRLNEAKLILEAERLRRWNNLPRIEPVPVGAVTRFLSSQR